MNETLSPTEIHKHAEGTALVRHALSELGNSQTDQALRQILETYHTDEDLWRVTHELDALRLRIENLQARFVGHLTQDRTL